jgi:hypothetical protein
MVVDVVAGFCGSVPETIKVNRSPAPREWYFIDARS